MNNPPEVAKLSGPAKFLCINQPLVDAFLTSLDTEECSANTKRDYAVKLNKLKKEVQFDADESDLIEFLSCIENPNTRSNKAFALMRIRKHHHMATDQLTSFREDLKKEINIHRKTKAQENLDTLCSYSELCDELDKLKGRDYFMNYMFVKHGMRNRDLNAVYMKHRPKEITENVIVMDPRRKKPKVTLYVKDYKTANVYGNKEIVIKDQRLFDEIKSLKLKNSQPFFATKEGLKVSDSYLNVLAGRRSIRKYGEGKIAKILVKHCIDNSQFDKVQELSEQRGTSLGTLYTSYNLMDSTLQKKGT